jgi:hypothetical protein
MTDEFDIRTIDVGLSSTIVQLFKLPQQMIDYLWERIDIAKKVPVCVKDTLAGNISHSYNLEDPRDLVVQKLYNIVYNSVDNPKMFEFINMEIRNSYRRSGLENVRLEPHLDNLWVNFQKKGEFQPIHSHSGSFSFVIWMDIPYHYKDEAKLHFAKSNSKKPPGGNFSFVTSSDTSRGVKEYYIEMSPEFNGYCCFFPSDLSHQVYPFYTSDKDRISISGNISYRSTKSNPPPVYQFPFHMSGT